MKIILSIVVALLILGGGGFWFGIYQPAQFTKELVFLYEDTAARALVLETPHVPIRDAEDYAGAKAELAARKEYFETAKRGLARLHPPLFGGEKIAKALSVFLDGEIAILETMERGADFFEQAVALRDTLSQPRAYRGGGQDARLTVPALAAHVRGVRDAVGSLFAGEAIMFWAPPVEVLNHGTAIPLWASDEISYAGLQAAWREAEPYFEELLVETALAERQMGFAPEDRSIGWPKTVSRLHIETRSIPFSQKDAQEKLNHFYDTLRFSIDRNSAEEILQRGYRVYTAPEDFQRRQEFIQIMQDIKTTYAQ